jgi:hypothetical protein
MSTTAVVDDDAEVVVAMMMMMMMMVEQVRLTMIGKGRDYRKSETDRERVDSGLYRPC